MHPQEAFESEFCDRLSTLLSQHVVVSANLQKVIDSHVDQMCGCKVGFWARCRTEGARDIQPLMRCNRDWGARPRSGNNGYSEVRLSLLTMPETGVRSADMSPRNLRKANRETLQFVDMYAFILAVRDAPTVTTTPAAPSEVVLLSEKNKLPKLWSLSLQGCTFVSSVNLIFYCN